MIKKVTSQPSFFIVGSSQNQLTTDVVTTMHNTSENYMIPSSKYDSKESIEPSKFKREQQQESNSLTQIDMISVGAIEINEQTPIRSEEQTVYQNRQSVAFSHPSQYSQPRSSYPNQDIIREIGPSQVDSQIHEVDHANPQSSMKNTKSLPKIRAQVKVKQNAGNVNRNVNPRTVETRESDNSNQTSQLLSKNTPASKKYIQNYSMQHLHGVQPIVSVISIPTLQQTSKPDSLKKTESGQLPSLSSKYASSYSFNKNQLGETQTSRHKSQLNTYEDAKHFGMNQSVQERIKSLESVMQVINVQRSSNYDSQNPNDKQALFHNMSLEILGNKKAAELAQNAKLKSNLLSKYGSQNEPLSAALLQEQRSKSVERQTRIPVTQSGYLIQKMFEASSQDSTERKLETLTLPTDRAPINQSSVKGPTPYFQQSFHQSAMSSRPVGKVENNKGTRSHWGASSSRTFTHSTFNVNKADQPYDKSMQSDRSSNQMPIIENKKVDEYMTAYQQENVIDGSKFVAKYPIQATRVKNNERRFEEIISQTDKSKLRKTVASYYESSTPFTQTKPTLIPSQIPTTAAPKVEKVEKILLMNERLSKELPSVEQPPQVRQRLRDRLKSNISTAETDYCRGLWDILRKRSMSINRGDEGVHLRSVEETRPNQSLEIQRRSNVNSVEAQQRDNDGQILQIGNDLIPLRRRQKKQPSQRSPQKQRQMLTNLPLTMNTDRQSSVQLQSILQRAVDSQQMSQRQLQSSSQTPEGFTNRIHREFLKSNNDRLQVMVRNKTTSRERPVKPELNLQSTLGSSASGSSPRRNFVRNNRSEIQARTYFNNKNLTKMYCPESGDPNKDQVVDYWRLQFLKEVERDQKLMNLTDNQKEVQMIRLQSIEETPHPTAIPEEKKITERMGHFTEKFSLRVPQIASEDSSDESYKDKQEKQEKEELTMMEKIQINIGDRMYQIQQMLADMEINEQEDQNSDSSRKPFQKPLVPKDAYRTIVEEKQILHGYCNQIGEINKKKEQNYWSQIKRVHNNMKSEIEHQAAFDIFMKQQQKNKAKQAALLHQQALQHQKLTKAARIAAYKKSKRMNKVRGASAKRDQSGQLIKEVKGAYEQMMDRAKHLPHKMRKAQMLEQLIEFQKALIAEFDEKYDIIQLEEEENIDFERISAEKLEKIIQRRLDPQQQIKDDVDFEKINEDELAMIIQKRLDRQLNDVFLRTEQFFRFHDQVILNQEQHKIQQLSKKFAEERSKNIELKIQSKINDLVPSMRTAASQISSSAMTQIKSGYAKLGNTSSDSDNYGYRSKFVSPQNTFKDIQSLLSLEIKKRLQKSAQRQVEKLGSVSAVRRVEIALEDVRSYTSSESSSALFTEINSAMIQVSPFKKRESDKSSDDSKESNSSNSVESQSKSSDAMEKLQIGNHSKTSNINNLTKLFMKRQNVMAADNSYLSVAQSQSSLVHSFSKAMARNIYNTIENVESHIQSTISKQLIKKTKYFKEFSAESSKMTNNLAVEGLNPLTLDNSVLHNTVRRMQLMQHEIQEEAWQRSQEHEDFGSSALQITRIHVDNIHTNSGETIMKTEASVDNVDPDSKSSLLLPDEMNKYSGFLENVGDLDKETQLKIVERGKALLEKKAAERTKNNEETSSFSHSQLTSPYRRRENDTASPVGIVSEEQLEIQMKTERFRLQDMLKVDLTKSKHRMSREQQQLVSETKRQQKYQANNQFVNNVLNSHNIPLPILNKIRGKYLLLQDYNIEQNNVKHLANGLGAYIPNSLQKMVLCNNNISDQDMANLISSVAKLPHGLKVLAVIHNGFAQKCHEVMCNQYLKSDAVNSLTKLIIKDPINQGFTFSNSSIIKCLNENVNMIFRLKQLVLQNVGLLKKDLIQISEFTTTVSTLRQLNISGNNLQPVDFNAMFDIMKPQSYSLSQLNISWNTGFSTTQDVQAQFEKKFADFIRHSKTLQHLDISGMGFHESTLKYIALQGLRKSKTLLAVHMSGTFSSYELLVQMRTWLKVVRISHKSGLDEVQPPAIEENANQLRRQNSIKGDKILPEKKEPPKKQQHKIHEYHNFLHSRARKHLKEDYKDKMLMEGMKKYDDSNSTRLNKILRQNRFQANITDRIVFQRFLGHYEILNGYRWHEVETDECYICEKWSYSLILWDTKLAQNYYENVPRSELGAEVKNSIFAPTVCSIDSIRQVIPMISIQSFLSRLVADKECGHLRTLKENVNIQTKNELQTKVDDHIQKKLKQRLLEERLFSAGGQPPSRPLKWQHAFKKHLLPVLDEREPQGVVQHQNFQHLYDMSCMDDSLWVCAAYLPPKHSSIVIQNQYLNQVQIKLCHTLPQKLCKQPKKSIKKIQEERQFNKEASVFHDWRQQYEVETKQWDYDMKHTKLSRFIKDPAALSDVQNVLLKYYPQIRDQFFRQICNPITYPQIAWLDFTIYCTKWEVIDHHLIASDVDRIFIAANVELEAQEANADKSLCRFEFYEILTRMAKVKFHEKGECATIADSLEKLLNEYILVNNPMEFDYQVWREENLWSLEIDDLYKANIPKLRDIFDGLKRDGRVFVQREQITTMFTETVKIGATKEQVVMAFAFSKMQFVEELEQIKVYERMVFVEFLDFLARLAFLVWPGDDETLDQKLWRMMKIMFKQTRDKVQEAEQSNFADSESDYEDEIASELIKKMYPQELYSGFGIIKPQKLPDDEEIKQLLQGGGVSMIAKKKR